MNRVAAKAVAWLGLGEPLGQRCSDSGCSEGRDIATEGCDFLDQPRGDRLMPRIRHEEDGLDVGRQTLIHADHLELVLEVRHGTKTADDHTRAYPLGVVD